MNRLALSDFLSDFRHYVFHLNEYRELLGLQDSMRKNLTKFCESANQIVGDQWLKHRSEMANVSSLVSAYRSVEWHSENYRETIPFTSKKDLRENIAAYLNPKYSRDQLWLRPTSGTTGKPLTSYYSPEFFMEFQVYILIKFAVRLGILNESILSRDVFCAALQGGDNFPNRVWPCPGDIVGLILRPTIRDQDELSLNRFFEVVEKRPPAIISSSPRILKYIAERASISQRASFKDVAGFISCSSELSDDLRQFIECVFETPVYDSYGLSEVGPVAIECHLKNSMHILHEQVLVEVERSDGLVAQEGEGEILVSSVYNDAMPLLRYRTGDIGTVEYGECNCGFQGYSIKKLDGRVLKNFRFGSFEYSPKGLGNLTSLFPIDEFRISQVESMKLLVEVQYGKRTDGLLQKVEDYLKDRMECEVHIEVQRVEFDEVKKHSRYQFLEGL
ncbi:phenylacetate--CoA ligase family protein [Pseudobacteriovorax antillogorgiicola]|uniref:Phenylacetate-coenzyme A ligase PaaK, adenylate-forming domain family n=1 Tax=Pseudobacteriovorax antillogorgiicola TaxID=1513793 RepID=A0A1Y6BG55_9BACT|nr:AMP-binding protein [Pseudobacteriovorax antillogorgiicola]TCS57551.1 phenylacetate-coenzyme A ligase PaaK-like adenylate-forming protein [Pseudobacteriovorax antillogorgiicola]SME99810.1 Phenylacetate-coenzyme A ligase PaaK, adenylate-forming domain family [Pseudobacteriovorax antillogorgiicola]